MRLPSLACVLVDGQQGVPVEFGTPLWHAILEWVRFHGIDPTHVPAGTRIVRDAAACCIRYTSYVFDEAGRIRGPYPQTVEMVERGEAPPLPIPA